MSNSNRVRVSAMVETTAGETPAATALQVLRFTGEELALVLESKASSEIRDDRATADVVKSAESAAGRLNIELSYGTFDSLFLLGAFQSSGWSSASVLLSAGSATIASGVVTVSSWAVSPVVGQWVKCEGFSNSANNTYFKILATTATTITLGGVAAMVDEGPTASVTITMGSQIVNGTTQPSYSIEKAYQDLSNTFAVFVGATVNAFSLSFPTDDFISGSFDFLAYSEANASSTIGSSYTAASTTKSMTSVANVTGIIEGALSAGAANGGSYIDLSMQMSNNLRGRRVIANAGFDSIGSGRLEITGSARRYFTSNSQFAEVLNFTESSFAVVAVDDAGNAYILEFPSIHWATGRRVASGPNDDVIADLTWQAKLDATELVMARLVRFPA